MRVVYLHGFASSSQSTKARFFAQKFAQAGIAFEAPDLDRGDFENLTITGQLSVLEKTVSAPAAAGGPLVLMGSSLGGYLAALFAAKHPREVDRLILLAPAFGFAERWRQRLSRPEIDQWARTGWIPVYHYGAGRERRLGFQFFEDSGRYPATPDFHQPALILHGAADSVVPSQTSLDFVRQHPQARLVLLQSGHELTDMLDDLWLESAKFLEMLTQGVV